jgi:uncharacterized protein YkwD
MEHKHIVIMILPVFVIGILMLGTMAATGNAQESSNTGEARTCLTCITPQRERVIVTETTVTPANAADQQTILNIHNRERAAVNTSPPDLVWSDSLAAGAASYTEEMIKQNEAAGPGYSLWPPAGFKTLRHDPAERPDIGENLASAEAVSSSTPPEKLPPSVASLVEGWVSESHNPLSGNHYTQMVWKTAKEVGCAVGIVRGEIEKPSLGRNVPAAATYLNCRYTPRGNTVGVPAY